MKQCNHYGHSVYNCPNIRNEVKGGIVIEQLKRYAKDLSEHVNESAMIKIEIWYHKHIGFNDSLDINLEAYHCNAAAPKVHISKEDMNDLRSIGKAINDMLRRYKK